MQIIKKISKFPDFKPFLFDLGDPNSCYCIAYQVIYSSAGSNLNFNFHKFECGLNSNMRVKFKGGLNCQLPTAIRVKSKCGLTLRAGKMNVITVGTLNYVHMKFPICPFLCEIYNSYLL